MSDWQCKCGHTAGMHHVRTCLGSQFCACHEFQAEPDQYGTRPCRYQAAHPPHLWVEDSTTVGCGGVVIEIHLNDGTVNQEKK